MNEKAIRLSSGACQKVIDHKNITCYYMAVSQEDWELPNSRIWLVEIDIESVQILPSGPIFFNSCLQKIYKEYEKIGLFQFIILNGRISRPSRGSR